MHSIPLFYISEFDNVVFMFMSTHTIYIRNDMGQKCEGNCGLWVLNKTLKKSYPEIFKEIMGAVWEIPAK